MLIPSIPTGDEEYSQKSIPGQNEADIQRNEWGTNIKKRQQIIVGLKNGI
jgi:hypothetical protein